MIHRLHLFCILLLAAAASAQGAAPYPTVVFDPDTRVFYPTNGVLTLASLNVQTLNAQFLSFTNTLAWSKITSTPASLSGYGITDAAALDHTHAFADLTSPPTTLAGYGITDAAALDHTHAFADLTSPPTTLSGYGITDAAALDHTHAFADLTSKPTTLAGYGITDGALATDLSSHSGNTSNPHNVTKAQVGLGNVENTALSTATIDAASNTIKMTGYIPLTHPHRGENVGAVWQTNSVSAANFGHVLFSATADQAANYVSYILTVPEDLDTSVDLKVARWKFKLSGADTGTHRYVISMASVANSADFAATPGTAINLDFAGDASGASGYVEGVANVTLTGWAAALTPGQVWIIRLARDGDATEDASTVASYSGPLVISYGITQ